MNIHHQQDDTSGLITIIVRCLVGVLLLAAAIATSLITTGCTALPIRATLDTPYGTITRDAKGAIIIAPIANPVRIPFNEK